jgi:hypothetical protein
LARLRNLVGWILIGVGLLGVALPILPGWLLLVPGIMLVGTHDPLLRRGMVGLHLLLRRLSRMKQRHLRRLGMVGRRRYHAGVRTLSRSACEEQRRRQMFASLVVALIATAALASLLYFIFWHR